MHNWSHLRLGLIRRFVDTVPRQVCSWNSSCCEMRVTRGSSRLAKVATADTPAAASSSPRLAAAAAHNPVTASMGAVALTGITACDAATTADATQALDAHNTSPAPAVAVAAADAETAKGSKQQNAPSRRRRTMGSLKPAEASQKYTGNGTKMRKTSPKLQAAAAAASDSAGPANVAERNETKTKRRRKAVSTTKVTAGLPSSSPTAVAAAGTAQSKAPAVNSAAAAAGGGGGGGGEGGVPLVDLGDIIVGKLIKRPSASVKTPYVADVQLPDGTLVLAHTPSLDSAGMIVPGSRVYMTANVAKGGRQQTTKTTHAVQLAEDIREDGQSALVGAHPYLAEKIADAAVQQHLLPLPQHLQGYTQVLKQQTLGQGRFDFLLCYEDGSRLLLEVKNAVCADFPVGRVPDARGKAGVYTSTAEPYIRTALFPIGSSKRPIGVVSDRAIKHLHELTLLQRARQDNEGRAVQCAVLFMVNRGDCEAFRPCHEADMMFARMLQRAQQAGVLVMAHDVRWQGWQALWGKQLPVVYNTGVNCADIDEEHLKNVLVFNATDSRTRWKKSK